MRLSEKYEFRSIHREEAEQAAEIEQICFPPAEAISREDVIDRVEKIPELFLVAVDRKNGKLAGYLTGFTTSEEAFQDKFFTNADLCDPDGKNNMLLGLEVLPKYRGQGLARELMMRYLDREQKRGRERAVLTCVDEKVEMYRRMGFEYIGISASVLGDEKWNEMEYRMKKLRHNSRYCDKIKDISKTEYNDQKRGKYYGKSRKAHTETGNRKTAVYYGK